MKKNFGILLILFILLISGTTQVSAESPYTTWALGPGGKPTMTQDAYSPVSEVDLPVKSPEDMFISSDGYFYIADTGNGQIVKLKDFQVVATYGKGTLEAPSGVFVDGAGMIYIADSKKNTIDILDPDGNLVKEFGRPTEPLFGKNRQFLPRKIAVDARQNLYIISEGSVDGVVQMNTNGEFIGYFGANSSQTSLRMTLQRTFLTPAQLSQFVKNEAASPSNLAIDSDSLVYTITAGTNRNQSIRKFNVAGGNIFPDTYGSMTFRALNVSDDGLILAVDSNGQIYEYDTNGSLLFFFGAPDTGEQRLGTLRSPVAIGRYQQFVYVLDKDKNAIVVYQETAFAQKVHQGVKLYMDGYYTEAKPYFEEVLTLNGSFILVYQAIADAYFKDQDYPDALTYYRYAEDQSGYSQSYWELRNVDLQKTLSPFILGLVAFGIVLSGFNRFERRYKWLDPVRGWLHGLTYIKLVDDFVFMFRFISQPADSFYYIKIKQRGSLAFAVILYLWVVAVRVLSLYVTGFTFTSYPNPADIHIENEITITLLLMIVWNAANYLVSTISDGEGRVRDVVIGTAYSLFPYALFALPLALISNVLTLNESFIYQFSWYVIYGWAGIMLFIMVMQIHNYSFSETFKNVLTTVFTMALFALTGYILYILFSQLIDFVTSILVEVGLRG